MPPRSLKRHCYRLLLAALAVGLLAWLSGQALTVLGLALVAWAGWFTWNTARLYRWLEAGEGQPPESVGIWSDVFDRIHRLRRKSDKERARYRAVIQEFRSLTDAFPDATLVLDQDASITWFNEAASKLLGLRPADDLGQPVTNLLREPAFADWIAVEGQVSGRFEMPSPTDADRQLSISAVRYREGQRLLILRDVTEVHNLERVRRDFVANVSHELRTPLTVLLGYLETLAGDCPAEIATAVARMQDQARQMQALLDDLLELSRLQNGSALEEEEERVDVPAVLARLVEQARELSQGRHAIDGEIDPGLALRGVAPDLESAFRNLISNAIHYTPAGGRIRIAWHRSGDEAEFSVTDTGIGILRRDIPRLTERFYRVGNDRSRHTGGTGLGLAIVKHVLNTHQARLTIASELGEGSTFRCRFPARRIVDPPAAVAGPRLDQGARA